MFTDRLRWHDTDADHAVRAILRGAMADARRDRPDVMTAASIPPASFAEVTKLTLERAAIAQQDAILEVGPDVELVVAFAADKSRAGNCVSAIPGLEHSRSSRALAAREAAQRDAQLAAARVQTASEAHRAKIESLVEYGLRAIQQLHAVIVTNHRFAHHLTFAVPTSIDVPASTFEIGLRRVQAAMAEHDDDTEDNDTDNERGAVA